VGLTDAGEAQARALGAALRETQIDLCVTTEFARTRRTAELVLEGRDVPMEIWPDLNDPQAGSWEGLPIDDYLVWASRGGSGEPVPGGGQSRHAIVTRCAARTGRSSSGRTRRFSSCCTRCRSPTCYEALEGTEPAPLMTRTIAYAEAHVVEAVDLRRGVDVLEAWCASPGW